MCNKLNNDGTSSYYVCPSDDIINITDFHGDECDGYVTYSESTTCFNNCQDDQSACEYGVFTAYDSADGTCDRTIQGSWDTFGFSYFTGI